MDVAEEVQAVEEMAEEVVLHFKRFSAEKQDQIRALVNYATLMGLDGKDLVSIGGKLDRIKIKQEIDHNRNIVLGMGIRPINKDTSCRQRWAWKGGDGTLYHFKGGSWYDVQIVNTKTNTSYRSSVPHHYEFGRFSFKQNRDLPNVMLNVYHGHIKLP